jgi:hypothetical protein
MCSRAFRLLLKNALRSKASASIAGISGLITPAMTKDKAGYHCDSDAASCHLQPAVPSFAAMGIECVIAGGRSRAT